MDFSCLNYSSLRRRIVDNLEQGYVGIGEVVAASSNSPILANLKWKAKHPMDGNLPDVYKLCVEYKVPILLHIDPPRGFPIEQLEVALKAYPDTIFIFAHANVYNSTSNVETLLRHYSNLYIDYFAGSMHNHSMGASSLDDFVQLMKTYPDRFFLSTDSAFQMKLEQALEDMYLVIDKLGDDVIRKKVAYDNFAKLIDAEPPTKTQIQEIEKIMKRTGKKWELGSLNKTASQQIIFSNE